MREKTSNAYALTRTAQRAPAPTRGLVALTVLMFAMPCAWAGDLTVVSSGEPVVVLRGAEIIGTTPLTLSDLLAGPMELGFREGPLSATAFTQVIAIPESGGVRLEVNLPERIASTVAPPPPATAAPASLTPPGPVAGASTAPAGPVAAPVAPPTPKVPAGAIYVTSTPAGASIFLDGAPVGAETPFVVRSLPIGKHTVDARSKCSRGSASITVADGTIARAELPLVEKPGSVVVSAGAPGSMVFMDGASVGKAPLTMKEVTCGEHTVAIRAPGYLESTKAISVLGYEALTVQLSYGTSPSSATSPPVPGSSTTGRSVQMFEKKEEFGTLVVDVTPLEAEVEVDGISVGAGPRSLDKIATGQHTVNGRLDGYDALSVDVTVEPDAIATATLALTRPALPPAPIQPTRSVTRKASSKPGVGRIVLDIGVSAIGLGAAAYSAGEFVSAGSAYKRYQTVPTDAEAQTIYKEEVLPARIGAYVSGGLGLLGIVAASGLWFTTEF